MSRPAVVPGIVLTVVLLAGAGAARGGPVFSSEVKVGDTVLGTFAIDTYQESSVVGKSFGISVQGGFNPSGDYTPPSGYEYRWIQTVSTSIPAYSWQDAGGVYVDRTREDGIHARSNTPFYGDGIVTPTPSYALPFADNPSRDVGPASFQGAWSLSLVLVQAGADPDVFNQADPGSERAIYQLATYVWGFDLDDQGAAVPRLPILEVAPDPAALAGIFAADPDEGTFGNDAWVVRSGLPGTPPTVIPEPSSSLLAFSAIAAAGVPALRRRRGRRAA